MNDLLNKVAIVTGGSRGIGKGICKCLAAHGVQVIVNYRTNQLEAEQTVQEIINLGGKALAIQADVSKKTEADQLVNIVKSRFESIHILVNNAGICPFRDFLSIDEQTWYETLHTNLSGAFFCAQSVAKVMVENQQGSIINISTVSTFRGGAEQVHYAASKGGLNSLTSSMANALGPHGIRVNTILCGGVITDINRHRVKPELQVSKARTDALPMQRLGDPEDLGQAVLFFASNQSAWVTGAQLAVDGGWSVI